MALACSRRSFGCFTTPPHSVKTFSAMSQEARDRLDTEDANPFFRLHNRIPRGDASRESQVPSKDGDLARPARVARDEELERKFPLDGRPISGRRASGVSF